MAFRVWQRDELDLPEALVSQMGGLLFYQPIARFLFVGLLAPFLFRVQGLQVLVARVRVRVQGLGFLGIQASG